MSLAGSDREGTIVDFSEFDIRERLVFLFGIISNYFNALTLFLAKPYKILYE